MIINADFLGHIKEHNSFAASAHENRQINKEIDVSGINGKIFNHYSFNGTELVVCTDDSTYLHIFSVGEGVNWEVRSTSPSINERSSSEEITFRLPSGTEIPWNWKETLDGFLGKQFAISASDQNLFLFWRGGEEHMISLLKNMSNDEIYMLINEA
ncbi:hypothetical protein [Pseudomonas sp. C9-3]|uniref:hypothetical protein n=1 Tax=Pseudomonas sp. C9-3 TaxID=3078264 RepID=UPI0028EB1683|nr:hypothetical protein [Pseudomonas sp. C9-3]